MKKRFTLQWMCAMLAVATGAAMAANPEQDAQALLAASDAVRSPSFSFGLTTSLTEYRNGKQSDASTLIVYAKPDNSNGQFNNLVQFVSPARDAGKLMLKNGNDLWLYDPANKASIRISPKQRLLGQAANGDVVTVNLAKDYVAKLVGQEEVVDGERERKQAHHLRLVARSPDVTYDHIDLWIETGSNRPIKAQFYSESGATLKTAYYRHYQLELGGMRPTETVIIDGLDPKWVTVMRFSKYAKRDVQDAWLQRDYLPRFKAE